MKTLQLFATALIVSLSFSTIASQKNNAEKSNLSIAIISISSPTCNGGDNGSVLVEALGGEAPYTFNWNTVPAQSTAEAVNLSSGIYFVQVTDAKGDVFFKSVHVDDPNTSVFTNPEAEINASELTASVSGLNAPYEFELNGYETTNQELNNLPVGIHKLVITDVNNCEMTQYIQVFEMPQSTPELKDNRIRLKSKEEVEASKLIPTLVSGSEDNKDNLVTVSSH